MKNRDSMRVAAMIACAALANIGWAQQVQSPRIAVTDLAYSQAVSQYFEASRSKQRASLNIAGDSLSTASSSQSTYVSGSYSFVEQRELGSFTNDIRGALLKGTQFRLLQGKIFDAGSPQPSKAEQVLNQLQTGKMAAPARQPEVKDIVNRIKKGEFNGADYVLFGTLSNIEFRDELAPLQGTTSVSSQFSLDLVADFSLINTKNLEIKAAFSAQGAGNDTKLVSNRGDIVRPNRGKVIRETSQSLAANVFEQLVDQLGNTDPRMSTGVRPSSPQRGVKATSSVSTTEEVFILK